MGKTLDVTRHREFAAFFQRNKWFAGAVVSALTAGYVVAFTELHPVIGATVAALSFLPVVVAALFWGIWRGLAVGFAVYGLNSVLFYLYGPYTVYRAALFDPQALVGTLALVTGAILVGAVRDLTLRLGNELARKEKAEKALTESEERYSLVAAAANDGLWDWDIAGGHIYVSPRWNEMLGYRDGELSRSVDTWVSLLHPDDRERVREATREHFANSDSRLVVEHRIRHRDGHYLWVMTRGAIVRDDNGTPVRMVGSMTDLTERTVKDALTGLPNRLLLLERLDHQLLKAAERSGHTPGAVVAVDIDGFGAINNSLGQVEGDRLLREVGRRLAASLRKGDTVARPGSDEFVLIVGNLESRESLPPILERLYEQFREPYELSGHHIEVSISAGVAYAPENYHTAEEILRDANIALEYARRESSGNYVVFAPHMHEHVASRMRLSADLRGAIERGELELFYQPIFEGGSPRLTRLEALLRWQHPEHGPISPAVFIPLAEEHGQIIEIGEWVLRAAAAQLSEWKERGHGEFSVEVNLSAIHFRDPERLWSVFCESIEENGLQPGDLGIEITETTLLEYSENIERTLGRFVDAGIHISIDDFGTGYSSMDYLKRLPVTTIKIDQSFVRDVHVATKNRTIVVAVLQLAESLGFRTIAEGVEEQEELDALTALGCHEVQGYLLGRPMTVEQLSSFLQTRAGSTLPVRS